LLLRIGALAAVVGGILRALGSFAPTLIESARLREALYAVIDLNLACGLIAFYAGCARRLAWWGSAGFALALAGLVTIRANPFISSADLYPAGALMIAVGIVMLTANAWRVKQVGAPVLSGFALSIGLGVMGSLGPDVPALFVLSGIVFGLAFAGLGVSLWSSTSSGPRPDSSAI
jgi:hypothetical protein